MAYQCRMKKNWERNMRFTHGMERMRTICMNLCLYSFSFLLLISKRMEEEHLCSVYESEDPNFG